MFLVNKYGMGLHNPMTSAKYNYTSSLPWSYELIGAVTGKGAFSTADHIREVKRERQDAGKISGYCE